MRQHEIGHVVGGEGPFEAIFSDPPGAEQAARIVDQDVDPRFHSRDLRAHTFHFAKAGEIGIVDTVRNVRATRAQTRERPPGTLLITCNEHQPCTHYGKLLGRDLADA